MGSNNVACAKFSEKEMGVSPDVYQNVAYKRSRVVAQIPRKGWNTAKLSHKKVDFDRFQTTVAKPSRQAGVSSSGGLLSEYTSRSRDGQGVHT